MKLSGTCFSFASFFSWRFLRVVEKEYKYIDLSVLYTWGPFLSEIHHSTMFSIKISAKWFAIFTIARIWSKSTNAQGFISPCDYCTFSACSAPNGLWVCCNNGDYQACIGGFIDSIGPPASREGCVVSQFECEIDSDPTCNTDFKFIPYNQGGFGKDFNNTCEPL